jgi:hypothetical protein
MLAKLMSDLAFSPLFEGYGLQSLRENEEKTADPSAALPRLAVGTSKHKKGAAQ